VDRIATGSELAVLPTKVTFETFPQDLRNVGSSLFSVEDAPLPGSSVEAVVELHAIGVEIAAVEVVAEDGGRAIRRVDLPGPGLRQRVTLELDAPTEPGTARYTPVVPPWIPGPGELPALTDELQGDDFRGDDVLETQAVVGLRSGAVVLVSASGDWEPRHLLAILGESTGLPQAGYVRVTGDQFVSIGVAAERRPPVGPDVVVGALSDAALIVAHRLSNDDSLTRTIAQAGVPLLVFPDGSGSSAITQVETGAPLGGEWYLIPDPPASPIAADIQGVLPAGLPPLTGISVVPAHLTEGPVTALEARRLASAENVPVLHLMEGEQRMAVATASGFWRWAIRAGEPREAYRRLWSSVAGWLLETATLGHERPDAGSNELPSLELLPAPWVPDAGTDVEPTSMADGSGKPLRSSSWPYLLVMALLCGEWYGRRSGGLR